MLLPAKVMCYIYFAGLVVPYAPGRGVFMLSKSFLLNFLLSLFTTGTVVERCRPAYMFTFVTNIQL